MELSSAEEFGRGVTGLTKSAGGSYHNARFSCKIYVDPSLPFFPQAIQAPLFYFPNFPFQPSNPLPNNNTTTHHPNPPIPQTLANPTMPGGPTHCPSHTPTSQDPIPTNHHSQEFPTPQARVETLGATTRVLVSSRDECRHRIVFTASTYPSLRSPSPVIAIRHTLVSKSSFSRLRNFLFDLLG